MSSKSIKNADRVQAVSCVAKSDTAFKRFVENIELPKAIAEIRQMMIERFGASLFFDHDDSVGIPTNGYVFLGEGDRVDQILHTDELNNPKMPFKDVSDATLREVVGLLKNMLSKTDNVDRQAEINNILTVFISEQEFRASGEPSIDEDFDKINQRILELVRNPDSAGKHDEALRGGETTKKASETGSQD